MDSNLFYQLRNGGVLKINFLHLSYTVKYQKQTFFFYNGKSSKFIYVVIHKIIPLISHTTCYAFSSPPRKKYESTNLDFSLSLLKCHQKYNNSISDNLKMDNPLNPFRIKNEMMKQHQQISTKMQLPQWQWITQPCFHGQTFKC